MSWKPLLFGLILLTGCSGQIKGTVFLDANANHLPDKSESTLTGVAIKVTYDGKELAAPKTDTKGRFAIPSKGPGYYCLEVTDAELGTHLLARLSVGALPSTSLLPSVSKVGIGPSVSVVAKQLYGNASMPICGNRALEGDEECDDGNRADGDGCSSTCKNQAKPETPTQPTAQPSVQSAGKICQQVNDLNFSAHIPVVLDYEADIADLPPPTKQTYRSGDDFVLTIVHPIGCVLESFYVPDVLEPYWNDTVEERDPNIASIDSQTGRIEFHGRVVSRSVIIPMRVRDDFSFGTHTQSFSPKAKCPDGKVIDLPSFEMDLVIQPNLEVEQRGLPASAAGGGAVVWEVTVKNQGKREYQNINLVLVPPSGFTYTALPHGCSNPGGGRFECPIVRLGSLASSAPVRFHLSLPDNMPAETQMVFNASVTIPDYEEEISAEESRVLVRP